jgi:hypothetical protein
MKPSGWQALLVVSLVVGGGAWPGPAARAAPGWDACAMVKLADLDAAFSPRRFEPGTPGTQQVAGTATLATVSTCSFVSRGATAKEKLTVSLLARRAPSDATGVTPAAAREGAAQLKATPVAVEGLGEGAYWVNLGSASFPVVELNLFRGKREWLIFGASGRKLDVPATVASLSRLAGASTAR